jgi:hypothetical protein
VAVDAKGNVYIADEANHRVRRVSPGGTITTFAGGGRGPLPWGDGGPATSATVLWPQAVAVDGKGNVYIGAYASVRKVTPDGTITTFAGLGHEGYGDGGPATSARFDYNPTGLTVDRLGSVYIAFQGYSNVRKVSPSGTITTFAGRSSWPSAGFSGDGGPATSARLNLPSGVAADKHGNVYIADSENNRVRKVGANGIITTFAGTGKPGFSGDGGPATSADLYRPKAVAVDGKGDVYIADSVNGRIRLVAVGPATAAIPKLILGGDSSQRLLAQKGIRVTARCSKPCSLFATGTVSILGTKHVFTLTRASAGLTAGTRTLTLRSSAAQLKRFRQLFKPGQQARAVITVKATDAAGRSSTSKRTVGVRA